MSISTESPAAAHGGATKLKWVPSASFAVMVWPGATDVGSATLTRLVSAAGSGSINMDDLFQRGGKASRTSCASNVVPPAGSLV